MQSRQKILSLAYGGMMAALVFVATCFLRLPIPVAQGYIHLGDGLILLGAALLGSPAVSAAAVGSSLADLLGGYSLYLLPTFCIKGAVAWIAVRVFAKKFPLWLTALALSSAELLMAIGYFLTEWLVLRLGLAAAAGALIPNLAQGLSGVALALALMPLMKRLPIHKKFM